MAEVIRPRRWATLEMVLGTDAQALVEKIAGKLKGVEAPTKQACQECGGQGWIVRERGREHWADPCECKPAAVHKARVNAIPFRFREAKLGCGAKYPEQAAALRFLKDEPERSYMFVGESNRGKTWLLYAQYRAMLDEGRRGIRVLTDAQLGSWARAQDGYYQEPFPVDIEQLRNAKSHHMFLDDLGKRRMTAYQRTQLWDMLDAIYSAGLGLTVTVQSARGELWGEDLAAWMDGGGGEYTGHGAATVRRLNAICEVVQL